MTRAAPSATVQLTVSSAENQSSRSARVGSGAPAAATAICVARTISPGIPAMIVASCGSKRAGSNGSS